MTEASENVRTAAPHYHMAYVWAISLVAALGGLLFGYDWVVINGAKPFYEKYFHLATPFQEGWATSCALVGCLLGAILAGSFSDRYGRKRLLIFAAVLFVVTGVGVALAHDTQRLGGLAWFALFRILGGMGIGLASNISPMYIAEVSPAEVRGKFVSLNQLTIVIGILLAQYANYLIGTHGDVVDQRRIAAVAPVSDAGERPGIAREFLARYGRQLKPDVVEAFLAQQGNGLTRDAVVEFLAGNDVNLPASYGELADRRLTPWNEVEGWRWMFGAVTLPGALFFLAMFFVPESPRWLVKNGRDDLARAVLTKIGGPDFAGREVAQIRATLVHEVGRVDFRELFDPRMRTILTLGVVLAVLQQWCGINVIFYYADKVFLDAGYPVTEILLNIVILGSVNMAFTFVAIFTVDRLGRRRLMLLGELGLAVLFAMLGAAYFFHAKGTPVLALVLTAMACYCCTLAPVTWVILSEIFPNRIRGAAMSVSVFALWVACFLLSLSFPIFRDTIGPARTFWIYSVICILGFFFILARLPETKGKTLEQIERELVD